MKRLTCRFFMIAFLVLFLSTSCDLLGPSSGNTDTTDTLAEEVVDELGSNLAAAAPRSVRAVSMTIGLSASQISDIKAAALAKVKSEGFENSTALDKILPPILEGVASELKDMGEDYSSALVVAAESVVVSAGKSERQNLVSSGQSITTVIASAARTAVEQAETVVGVGTEKTAVLMGELTQAVIAAVDEAETVSLTSVETVIQKVVKEAAAVAAGSTNAEAALGSVVAAAAQATAGVEKIAAGEIAGVMETVAGAAAEAVAEAEIDSTIATTLVETVAVQVVVAAAQTGVNVTAAAIATSVTQGVGDSGINTANVGSVADAAAGENEVSAVAKIQAGSGASADSVSVEITQETSAQITLFSSESTGDYTRWTQIQGPAVEGFPSTNPQVIVSLDEAGTYIFELTVKNSQDGYKFAKDRVSATVTLADEMSSLDLGLQYLASKNFSAARTAFAQALAQDSTNVQAKIWKSVLDMAALSVDSKTVSLFKDHFGFVGYPTDLNTALSDTWFTDQWYDRLVYVEIGAEEDIEALGRFYVRGDFVSDSSSPYCFSYNDFDTGEYYDFIYGYFVPNDDGPYVIGFYYDAYSDVWNTSAYGADGSKISYESVATMAKYKYSEGNLANLTKPLASLPEINAPDWATGLGAGKTLVTYPFYIIANIIDKNPSGLNAMVDAVLDGPFGSNFDTIAETLEGLGEGDSVVVPPALIAAYAGSAPETSISIGKAELLAYAGQMRTLKAVLQLIASYDFSYPLSALNFELFFPEDEETSNTDLDTLMSAAHGPFVISSNTKLLEDRSQTVRDAARDNLVMAMTDLIDAAGLVSTKLTNGDYNEFIPSNEETTAQENADHLASMIDAYIPTAEELKDAVADGSAAFDVPAGEDTTVASYPGKLFDSAVFSLPNLFEYETTGTIQRPVLYALTGVEEYDQDVGKYMFNVTGHEAWATAKTDESFTIKGYSLKLNIENLAEILPVIGDLIPKVEGETDCYLDLSHSEDFDLTDPEEKLGLWALGYTSGEY